MQVLVLASGSQYRSQLLRRLNYPFTQFSPDIDESPQSGEKPDDLALRLAIEKAHTPPVKNYASSLSETAIIIASDQVASVDKQLLGKPGTLQGAHTQLQTMSGKNVTFSTSLCVLNLANGQQFTTLDTTIARLRELDATEIDRYLTADNPLDCAGSFKIEALGISLFNAVESSDPTALIGLPMIQLCQGLREMGMQVP